MTCTICGSNTSPAVVDRPFRMNKRKDHIETGEGTTFVLLCTKRKTHMISRKVCYDIGVIRRKR